jgi:hypothetical protein
LNFKKYYKIYLSVFAIIFLGGVFFYAHRVYAWDLFGIETFTYTAVTTLANGFIYYLFTLIGKILASMISVLDTFSRFPVYPKAGVPVVIEVWKIMRDMANMVFIVALVVAAFATIFDTFASSMSFFKGMNWQQTLVKLLISAVLINFSLTLGVLVLDIAQVPTNMLLKSMGDIAGNLGAGLNVSAFITDTGGGASKIGGAFDATGGATVSLIFGIVMLGAFLVCILTGLMFIVYRIPMIWMLLMFSPLIWIARIFPQGEKSFSEWWSKLIGWAFFLPYYFFFVYLALYLLGNQDKIMEAVMVNMSSTPYGVSNPGISVQLIFFYTLVCIILMGGTKMAVSWANNTGAVSKGFFAWADKSIKRVTPGLNYLEASRVALKAKGEQIAKEGLRGRWTSKIYGGDLAQEKKEAQMKDAFRVGDRDASKGVLQKDVNLLKGRYKNESKEKLEQLSESGTANQRIASLEVLRSRGELGANGTRQLYDQYAKQSPQAAKDFAMRENYAKMNAEERAMFFGIKGLDPEVQRKIALVMAEKGDIRSVDEIGAKMKIFGNPEDRREFFDKLSKTLESMSKKDREDLWQRGTNTSSPLYNDRLNDNAMMRQLATIMVEKGDISKAGDLEERTRLLFGSNVTGAALTGTERQAAKEFIDKAKKKNLIVAIEAQARLNLVNRDDGSPITDFSELLEKEVKKMKPADLLEIPVSNITIKPEEEATARLNDEAGEAARRTIENKRTLKATLRGSLSRQKLDYILTNATKEQLKEWKEIGEEQIEQTRVEAEEARDAEADAFAKALAKYMAPKP